jgi:23S rRNA (cytosine1962-C5)-methyltransferase
VDIGTYNLLDSGEGRKLERFGDYVIARPCAQAVWRPRLADAEWRQADAEFTRRGGNRWIFRKSLPEWWPVQVGGVRFRIQPTDFGHLGVFPEHAGAWDWLRALAAARPPAPPLSVLNLFAYSGGATLAAARLGWRVCHLDASRKMVAWARENAALNTLSAAPIRWIVDDVQKFLQREARRKHVYDGIILDPPSFGRGRRQEIFKIDDHLLNILALCRAVLSESPAFIHLSCHTPGYTPLVLHHLLAQSMDQAEGTVETGEMTLGGGGAVLPVPCGTWAAWQAKH